MVKEAVVLINVGTPDNYKVKAVQRYLSQFLNDPRVMDLPWLLRKVLVNAIIVPFRAPISARLYQKLWTSQGSPLLTNLLEVQKKLQALLPPHIDVFAAMRYQNPSIPNTLEQIKKEGYDKVTLFPLFPQYASSTTGTAIEAALKIIGKWNVIPEIRTIEQFYLHPAFIDAFAQKIESHHPRQFDYIVFSYHGLPNRQLNTIHPEIKASECSCKEEMPAHGRYCYKAACYETTRLLVKKLQLDEGTYSTAFQSRLSKNWMSPFTDSTLNELALMGKKRILVTAPSFVADCLETSIEIADEYRKMFENAGGEKLTLVESLNADEQWIEALHQIINDKKNRLMAF
ncbi:MAG: ferrochelatase [Prolixibacteraceae bacterium]|nr:ferrochelatase [Prolixibacteraceae bacterium]MBN2649217.1 ferrochelatase [Prolixibacteraceae bacterium]